MRARGLLHSQVFPLSSITDASVDECQTKCCGGATAPTTLTIKVGSEVVIAIDSPVDGDAFCALVMRQADMARGRDVALPPDVAAAYNTYRMGSTSDMSQLGMMMSAMMGATQAAHVAQTPVSQQPQPAPPPSAPPSDIVAQLQSLAALRDQGVLSDDEFDAAKAKLLNIVESDAAPPQYNQVLVAM
jgi:hypothetical protein